MTKHEVSEENPLCRLEDELSDLQNIKLGNGDDAEIQKLKRLFLTFKTKYQQALKELAKNEQQQGSSHLQKKYDEILEENKALVQQQQALREMLKKGQTPGEQSDSLRLEELNRKLQSALQEKDLKIADLKYYELGFKRLSDENRKLESILNAGGQGERESMREEISVLKAEVERLAEQCKQQKQQAESYATNENLLQSELKEQKGLNQSLKVDLDQMKDSMVRGLREARELKHYYQNLINEKTTVLEKNTLIQRQVEELRLEIKRKEQALDSVKAEAAAFQAERQEVERRFDQERKEKAEREENLNSLGRQIQSIRQQLDQYRKKAAEKEREAIEAQQHLAKKVRESAQLSEKVEEKHRLGERLQEEMIDYKMKQSELQAQLEKEKDKAGNAAQQMEAVEKKYFRTHEKLQKVEAEVRELRKVEERHQQMQQLLSNLGTVIGQPVGIAPLSPSGQESVPSPAPARPVEALIPIKKTSPRESKKPVQDDLFKRPDNSPGYKKDLFE